MKCQLCLQEETLCRSHIIPEFLYKGVYDPVHRFCLIPVAEPDEYRLMQKGVREKLLCVECETQLSRYEKYGSEALCNPPKSPVKNESDRIIRSDLDYSNFKLFQLSILWRAGVSKHPVFDKVNLGPHQEKLRQLLLKENPGEPYQYPCLIGIVRKPAPLERLLVSPESNRFYGHRCYVFLLAGAFWLYFVSSHAKQFLGKEPCLTRAGELTLLKLPGSGENAMQLLTRHMGKES